MGIGAMLQGQQLFVAGVFVMWPVFAGRPVAAFRWISGFALAFSLVASGWMLTTRPDVSLPARFVNWTAAAWVGGCVSSLALVGLRGSLRGRVHGAWFLLPGAVAAVTICFPPIAGGDDRAAAIATAAAAGLIALFWFTTWATKRYLLATTLAASLFACIPFFGASTAWWKIGFLYGAERFPMMTPGPTNNLAAILEYYFDWRRIADVVVTIPEGGLWRWPNEPLPVNIKQVLVALFAAALIASAVAIARQWRRGDRNLLPALVLPWVLFYTLLPQISPRYSVFVAGIGAICIGRSIGLWLLVLLFSLVTVMQTMLLMIGANGLYGSNRGDALFNGHVGQFLNHFNPGISFAVLVAAGVLFWCSFCRSGGLGGPRATMRDEKTISVA